MGNVIGTHLAGTYIHTYKIIVIKQITIRIIKSL